jgi:membrane protein implicated in regulation of membrane protease activity
MKKELIGVLIAACLFAVAIFSILYFFDIIAILAAMLFGFTILAIILVFVLLFAFGSILFFAAFYYLIKKKPEIQADGNYTLNMEKGKNDEEK